MNWAVWALLAAHGNVTDSDAIRQYKYDALMRSYGMLVRPRSPFNPFPGERRPLMPDTKTEATVDRHRAWGTKRRREKAVITDDKLVPPEEMSKAKEKSELERYVTGNNNLAEQYMDPAHPMNQPNSGYSMTDFIRMYSRPLDKINLQNAGVPYKQDPPEWGRRKSRRRSHAPPGTNPNPRKSITKTNRKKWAADALVAIELDGIKKRRWPGRPLARPGPYKKTDRRLDEENRRDIDRYHAERPPSRPTPWDGRGRDRRDDGGLSAPPPRRRPRR